MPDQDQDGLFSSLRKFPGLLVAVLRNRIELFSVEWQEERLRLFGNLLLGGAILICSLLALGMLTLTILIAAGEQHRLLAAIIITVVYAAAAVTAAVALRHRLRNWSPFNATRSELRKDCEWLERKDPNS